MPGERNASQEKQRVPPVIEIAGNLYLVEDWDIDEGVGDRFTLSRLSKKEETWVRQQLVWRDDEIWGCLLGARQKKKG